MFDFDKFSTYTENSRLEAKRAVGGLPQSIWQTYSAFANTDGGVILLGIEENADKSLDVIGVNRPEKLAADFWNTINNPQKVSINLLNDNKLKIIETDGKQIISIEVPRAERRDKPVYIGENPLKGTFKRIGEGDFRCVKEEVSAMLRDQSGNTQDMLVLEKMNFDVFCKDSIRSYRNAFRLSRPDHVWINLEEDDFLYRIGAAAYGDDGRLHPTAGGLLMFGYEYEIVKEYPQYFLDYQEQYDLSRRWDDRFVSSSGEWSGNIYDFYRKAYNKLSQNIPVPFKIANGLRVEDTPVHKAVREGLANCLINADYYERRGLVIKYTPKSITMENPGRFRIDIAVAIEGTTTDPRNSLLMKFFNMIDIGERSGRGIYEIYKVWADMNWDAPTLSEMLDIYRTKLTLPMDGDKKVAIKNGDKKTAIKNGDKNDSKKTAAQKAQILAHIEEAGEITARDVAVLLGVGASRSRLLLSGLVKSGRITAQGDNKSRRYSPADNQLPTQQKI